MIMPLGIKISGNPYDNLKQPNNKKEGKKAENTSATDLF